MLLFHVGLYILSLVRALNRNNVLTPFKINERNFGHAKLCHRMRLTLSSNWQLEEKMKTPVLAFVRMGLELHATYLYSGLAKDTLFSEDQAN